MEIPKRTCWDGGYKYKTEDCETCEYYRQINEKEICGWGVAFKYLCQRKNPRKCEVKNRQFTKEKDLLNPFTHKSPRSINHLDTII